MGVGPLPLSVLCALHSSTRPLLLHVIPGFTAVKTRAIRLSRVVLLLRLFIAFCFIIAHPVPMHIDTTNEQAQETLEIQSYYNSTPDYCTTLDNRWATTRLSWTADVTIAKYYTTILYTGLPGVNSEPPYDEHRSSQSGVLKLSGTAGLSHCKLRTAHLHQNTMKPRALVVHGEVSPVAVDLLATKCEIVRIPGPPAPSYEDIVKYAKGVTAILWASKHQLDSRVIESAGPNLRVVSTISAGYDNIDVKQLKAKGVAVGNAPSALHEAVADIGVALLLTTARRLQEGRKMIEQGTWTDAYSQRHLGRDVAGSTVGIVGLGGIGYAFAKRISVFGIARLLYTGHKPKPEASKVGAEFVSFDELVSASDFILLACPLTNETKNMFNENVFKKMKSSAILLNVGRGGCVDQDALVKALQTNEIGGAGLDVMSPEPLPTDHPLISLPNCVLFPHLGSATKETRAAMATLAVQNILKALQGEPMPSPIS